MKKHICIIHSGGTIGMAKTQNGYTTKHGYLAQMLKTFPTIWSKDMPDFTLVEMEEILDSSSVAVEEWNEIGRLVHQNYEKYDGFVVLHGTDTMSYTASALSFMLQNLDKPVVLTGSQIPFCEVRNDALENLVTSMVLATSDDLKEVCLCFGGKLLRGNRSTKVSADELVAFDSPNYPPLAVCGVTINMNKNHLLKPNGPFKFLPFDPCAIAVLKVFPGIQFDIFKDIMTQNLKGIVLEAFGAGNIPTGGNGLGKLLQKAQENNTAIVVCTQCLQGSARLGLYQSSNDLKQFDAICGFDMTTEAAVAKLYFLLTTDPKNIADRMEQDLAGEISHG